MVTDIDPALLKARDIFFEECRDFLQDSGDRLIRICEDPGNLDPEDINAVFRAVHSVKGASGALELDALNRFSHGFETVLSLVREGKADPGGDLGELLVEANDMLLGLLETYERGETPDEQVYQTLLAALSQVNQASPLPQPSNGKMTPCDLPEDLSREQVLSLAADLAQIVDTGSGIEMTGSRVKVVSSLALQVIMVVKMAALEKSLPFRLVHPSPALEDAIGLLGMSSLLHSDHIM